MIAHRPTSGARAMPAISLIVLGCLLATGPASAGEPAFDRTAGKTATYLTLSALNNFAFGAYSYGGLAAGGLFALVSITTEPVVYYVHEAAWNAALTPLGIAEQDVLPMKTTSYTVVNAARLLANGWVLTGSMTATMGFLAFNIVSDSVAYAINDLAWTSLFPGPAPAPAGAAVGR